MTTIDTDQLTLPLRHRVLPLAPPNLPVRSVMQEQTGGSRLLLVVFVVQ